MSSIQEKYEKFMISNEMRDEFEKFRSNYYSTGQANQEIVIETIETKNGASHTLSKEITHAKLV